MVIWRPREPGPAGSGGSSSPDADPPAVEELQQALEALQADHDRAVGALRSVRDGVVVCDEHGTIVLRNSPVGEPGRGPDLLEEQAVREALLAALQGHAPERQVELFGPPRRVLEVTATPIQRAGRVLGAVAVVEDVSERRRIEQVRRDFVSNISHELRTPVGALCVLAETMAAETSAAVLRRLAQRIELESNRLARMIDDLLTLTMIEAEEVGNEPVSVRRFVEEAIERIGPAAERRSITIDVGIVPHASVLGDRRQLTSAVFNLLDNAVKYSEEASTVRVRVVADESGSPGLVRIEVADEGIGIPPRDRERIFERFYRVDKARTRDTGGTGLGLAIVRHVVNNHRGEVTVTSREGEGSTFTITLPTAPAAGTVRITEAS